jgi:hypothetical protein
MAVTVRAVRRMYGTPAARSRYVRWAASMLHENGPLKGVALPWNDRDFALLCEQAWADYYQRQTPQS